MTFVKPTGVALAAAALLYATTAHAQTLDLGAAPEGPGSAVVEELLVVARAPGPAIWLVEKGGARLYVVGSAVPLPHPMAWKSPRLERALDQADLLLVPPKASVGPAQIAGFVLKGGAGLRQGLGDRLEDELPPDLKARFVSGRTRAKKGAGEYRNWQPAMAGFLLLSDFRQAAGLSEAKPVSTIERMARARKVRIKAVGQYRMSAVVSSAGKLSKDAQLACLRDALDELEYEGGRPRTIGSDWARGDLASVRARYSTSAAQRCLLRSPGGAKLLEQQISQSANALSSALNRPGVTVAVVDLAFLLPANGVLDRLKAGGATVTSPPD
ncbi:MAG: TraB/GumN family protein [Caulobacter sp. 12-67-6]|nr:MAG: TraB/GumN family protein [Caulobacter sp. 12-67-6]OYX98181.1 MAG: TraB/GumN family protein [Caulobacter sp. 35-67-4]